MDFLERYLRQINLGGFSQSAQERLAGAKLALIGLGGVGSATLPLLAGGGVGKIVCVDSDIVSLSNLHRQTFYTEDDLDRLKSIAAKERAQKLNSEIKVTSFPRKISTLAEFYEIAQGCDLCIDATDSFSSRLMIAEACEKSDIPLISASAAGWVGQVVCISARKSFKTLVSDPAAAFEEAQGTPIFGPAAHFSGVIAAAIALKFLAGCESFPEGKLISMDLSSLKFFSTVF